MGLFGFRKKDRVIDLTDNYKKQQEKEAQVKAEASEADSKSSQGNVFGIFDSGSSSNTDSTSSSEDYIDVSSSSGGTDEKKRKLAKRIMEMTTKVEDLSNQIYHLQQRIELLERKLDIRRE